MHEQDHNMKKYAYYASVYVVTKPPEDREVAKNMASDTSVVV